MVIAIAVSLSAVGAVLGAYTVLTREMARNYLATNPASATLDVEDGVGPEALAIARAHPLIESAEAHDVVMARARVGQDYKPILLFVVDKFSTAQLNKVRPTRGATDPAPGTMLIERTAQDVLHADLHDLVHVKMARGQEHDIPVTGMVHDPGLAPAWQEQMGYGYITKATLESLGEAPVLHELRIKLSDPKASSAAIGQAAADIARQLKARGMQVHEVRMPPPRQHPHERQMKTVLLLMLSFSVMALVLSAVLIASSLTALLARQLREIGVMKVLGAQRAQIARMYTLLVISIGALATMIALPTGVLGARTLTLQIGQMLNLNIEPAPPSPHVFLVQILAGLLIPWLLASFPVRRASRISVREAMNLHGGATAAAMSRLAALPQAAREALRRPGRLGTTVGLLAAGGAIFMTALNLSQSWQRTVDKVYETRHYDVELRFLAPQEARLLERITTVPGVLTAQAWGYSKSALSRMGQVDVVHTYPDQGHGSMSLMAPPADTKLIDFPVTQGRWLRDNGTTDVVLNHTAAAQAGHPRIGDPIVLAIDAPTGRKQLTWKLVGIVEEIGAAGVAYIGVDAFSKATGTRDRFRLLRVATNAASDVERARIIRAIEQRLAETGVSVEIAAPLSQLRTAMADHISILISALVAMAAVMATVGILGLGSTMSASVVERTREFAVMKALGATPGMVRQLIANESALMAALSWVVAVALAVPLTFLLDSLIGQLGFVAPLPYLFAPWPALAWLLLIECLAVMATLVPAVQAGRLSIAQALVQV